MKQTWVVLVLTVALGPAGCTKSGTPATDPVESRSTASAPRSEVPAELVGSWEHGSINFALWENYKEGHYAGRNAAPTREAMTIGRNGEARFYRYEMAYPLYEELIDCDGTVAFDSDTFTFTPVRGRKRHFDTRHSANNQNRPLTPTELTAPKLAGKRRYAVLTGSTPPAIRITVPGSAPYNWYKKE